MNLGGAFVVAQSLAGPAVLTHLGTWRENGVVLPGTVIPLSIQLHNVGGESANDLQVQLEVGNGPIDVSTDTISGYSLAGGEVSAPMGGLSLSIPLRCAGEQLVPLQWTCLLYTSPSPRDKRQSRMPSSA